MTFSNLTITLGYSNIISCHKFPPENLGNLKRALPSYFLSYVHCIKYSTIFKVIESNLGSICIIWIESFLMVLDSFLGDLNSPQMWTTFLEWHPCRSSTEGFDFQQNNLTIEMLAWPYICQFSSFLFVKKNLLLNKRSILLPSLFTFFRPFSIKISCHNMFEFLKLQQMIRHKLIWHFFE